MNKENIARRNKSQINIWRVLTAISIFISCLLAVYCIIKINNYGIITPDLQDKINNFEPINPYLEERLISAKKFVIYPLISSLISIVLYFKSYMTENSILNKKGKV